MRVTVRDVKKLANDLDEMRFRLEAMVDGKNETLDNTNSAQYPNGQRLEKLEQQAYVLQQALDDLENLISALEEYE